jgi:phage portal protein BeeE
MDIATMSKDKNYNIGDMSSESDVSLSRRSLVSNTTTMKISLEDAIQRMKQWLPLDAPRVAIDCQKELTEQGLLSGYYRRLKNGAPIDPENMFETVLILNEISLLTLMF